MAIETIGTRDLRPAWRLPTVVTHLPRFIRRIIESRRATTEFNALSDHYLRDVGVDRPDIPEFVRREFARDALLDTGWQRRDNSHRR